MPVNSLPTASSTARFIGRGAREGLPSDMDGVYVLL